MNQATAMPAARRRAGCAPLQASALTSEPIQPIRACKHSMKPEKIEVWEKSCFFDPRLSRFRLYSVTRAHKP